MIQVLEGFKARAVLVLLLTAISLFCFQNFKGSLPIYAFFSIISIFYICKTLTTKVSFFSLFTCGFLTLGFYLKLNAHLATKSYVFGDAIGQFSFSGGEYDRAILLSTFGILGFSAANEFFQWVNKISYRPQFLSIFDLTKKERGLTNQQILWISLALLVLSIAVNFLNLYFRIYQRGVVSDVPESIRAIWTIFLMFGLSLLIAVVVELNGTRKSSTFYLIILAMIDAALTSISLLSRGFVLYAGVFVLGFWYTEKQKPIGKKIIPLVLVIMTYFLLTVGTVKAVTIIRDRDYLSTVAGNSQPQEFKTTFLGLFIGRWVGLEGVMSAISFNGDREITFQKIWEEKIGPSVSVYDSEIALSNYVGRDTTNFNFVTIPGLVGWLSILDSATVVFFGCFSISILFYFFELLFLWTFNSFWISAVIGHVLAFRIIHFGYVPKQSYKLFLGLILFGLIMCILLFVIKKLSNRKEKIE